MNKYELLNEELKRLHDLLLTPDLHPESENELFKLINKIVDSLIREQPQIYIPPTSPFIKNPPYNPPYGTWIVTSDVTLPPGSIQMTTPNSNVTVTDIKV